jgi:hypothetical protein
MQIYFLTSKVRSEDIKRRVFDSMNRSTKSLILNVIFPSLFLGGLAGTGLGYWLAKPGQAPTEAPVLAQKTQDLQEEQKLPPTETQTENTKEAEPASQAAAHQQASAAQVTFNGNYPTPAPEVLQKMADKTWIPGTVQSKEVNPKTGEINTTETLPDGSTATRNYRTDGSLKSEEITDQDGSERSRNFFETGNVKVAYVKNPDGSATSVLYDSTGSTTQETTQYKDGTTLYSDFDDRGNKISTSKISSDGNTEEYNDPN